MTESLWVRRCDVVGNPFQRYNSNGIINSPYPQRSRITHKQAPQRRKEPDGTDDADSTRKRFRIVNKQSLHSSKATSDLACAPYRAFCTLGNVACLTTDATGRGGSAVVDDVAKRARAGQNAEIEISAVEPLNDAKLGVDQALCAETQRCIKTTARSKSNARCHGCPQP